MQMNWTWRRVWNSRTPDDKTKKLLKTWLLFESVHIHVSKSLQLHYVFEFLKKNIIINLCWKKVLKHLSKSLILYYKNLVVWILRATVFSTSRTPRLISVIHWPQSQNTNIHLFLSQHEANTPYASLFFQSLSPHAAFGYNPTPKLEDIWRTSWMLLRVTMKSWAIPEGDGRTSVGIRLGQEAALCGEGRKWHTEVKENNGSLHPLTYTSTNQKYLSCLSGQAGNERVKSFFEGSNNGFKQRDDEGLEKQTRRTLWSPEQSRKWPHTSQWPHGSYFKNVFHV